MMAKGGVKKNGTEPIHERHPDTATLQYEYENRMQERWNKCDFLKVVGA